MSGTMVDSLDDAFEIEVDSFLYDFKKMPPNYEIDGDVIRVSGGDITNIEHCIQNAPLIQAILTWDKMDDDERYPEN